jgi:formate dehydrogenase maturation protein FdhE
MKVKSAQITDAEVCAQALTSAQLEFFHYGEEEFRLREAQLRKVAENTPLEQFLNFHTYEELVAKFQRGMSMNHNVESTVIVDENLVNLS